MLSQLSYAPIRRQFISDGCYYIILFLLCQAFLESFFNFLIFFLVLSKYFHMPNIKKDEAITAPPTYEFLEVPTSPLMTTKNKKGFNKKKNK